ncbi:MAG: hypothetical protein IPJ41_09855 [Phycisphaerales bacterium]|nr:hypothetical protein [Phycisphaerales bacterium]
MATPTAAISEVKSTSFRTPAPARSGDLFWAALTSDSGSAVLVYDAQGRLTCVNDAAMQLTGKGADVAARTLHDILPAAISEERLAHATQVLETGATVVIDGMINGRLTRSTLRAVKGESAQENRVLETIRPVSTAEPKPEGVTYIRAKTDDEGVLGSLTAREREVLIHIGRGLSTAEIASTLGRSTKTVEWHRVSLGNKLGITNRVELARIAIRAGVAGLAD